MQGDHPSRLTRVGLVSHEPLRLAGLLSVFEDHHTIVPVNGTMESMLSNREICVVILDISEMADWQEMLLGVRRQRPDVRFVVLGQGGNDELVLRAIVAGARAYLDHQTGPLQVRQAVEVVLQGSIWAPRRLLSILIDRLLTTQIGVTPSGQTDLSPRERQVLELIMKAYSNREIGAELGIEERTVKAYVASLMRKTGVENRVALSVAATHEQRSQAH
jgi:DNA-binding NarL/FixJ family response regulator